MHTRTGAATLSVVSAIAFAVLVAMPGQAKDVGLTTGHLSVPADGGGANAVRLRVAPTGNEARYRVRERLLGRELPNDAVGTTGEVSGMITLAEDGRIVPAESRLSVRAGGFTSDQDRRDGYVRGGRLLDAANHPTIDFAATELHGLSGLPTSGSSSFDLLGTLTVRGVTRPVVWRATAAFSDTRVTGSATTGFTFEDFEITKPRVPAVLSVADTIRLEYDFVLLVERGS